MERAVGEKEVVSWKVRNEIEKNQVGKFGPKFESDFIVYPTYL